MPARLGALRQLLVDCGSNQPALHWQPLQLLHCSCLQVGIKCLPCSWRVLKEAALKQCSCLIQLPEDCQLATALRSLDNSPGVMGVMVTQGDHLSGCAESSFGEMRPPVDVTEQISGPFKQHTTQVQQAKPSRLASWLPNPSL
jgi:hypothetical protein